MPRKPTAALPRAIVLATLTLVATAPAHAQQPASADDLEEVIVTGTLSRFGATKSDTPIMDLARSVSIETQQDLLDKGALNLADAYVYSAGVAGERYGFATRGDWLAVRGLDVPEYRDSLQALFGNYNNTRPDIYTIEQVEILKGPASVLYGQGTAGGIVNIVSKTPRAGLGSELVAEAGNFGRQQLAADLNGSLGNSGDWLYRVVGVYRNSDTQVEEVQDDAIVFAPSLRWQPGDDTAITLLANIQRTDSDTGAQFHPVDGTLRPAPNGGEIPFDAYTGEPGFNRYDTDSESLTLLAEHQLNDTWSIESTARWTSGSSDYRQAWVAFSGGDRYARNPDGSLYGDGTVPRTFYVAENSSEQYAIDTRARARFATGDASHHLLVGVQYQDVETDTDTAYLYALGFDFATRGPDDGFGDRFWINTLNPVPSGRFPDQALVDSFFADTPAATTEDLGLYINDHVTLGPWNLTLGLRYDEVDTDTGATTQSDDALSTSVGLLYQSDLGIAPYVSYAESFEPVVGTDNFTNQALQPQEGEQVEYGIKYQSPAGNVVVTLARFDTEVSNLPNPNSLVNAGSQQEGVSKVEGTELEAYLRLGAFSLELNASRLDMENPDGFTFASVPEEQLSAWLGWRPGGELAGLRAGAGIRYVGESWDGTDSLRTPDYTLGDLMLGYTLGAWDLALNVRNVTDKEYMATCLARGDCFLGEARTVVGRFTYRF
jgi:iron complex outermembrane receptor protein